MAQTIEAEQFLNAWMDEEAAKGTGWDNKAPWFNSDLVKFATAFSAHQNAELTRELALWKRSMCVLYELIEDTPCPHPPAAIGLVTSSVDKLRQRLASLREELERMKESLRGFELLYSETKLSTIKEHFNEEDSCAIVAAHRFAEAALSGLTKEGK